MMGVMGVVMLESDKVKRPLHVLTEEERAEIQFCVDHMDVTAAAAVLSDFGGLIPSWACSRWGDWEHDWLDCCECLERYEVWLGRWLDEVEP